MTELPPELEETESKPQPKTKSQIIYEELKSYKHEDITPELKRTLAEKHGCSNALVHKMFRRLEEEGYWETIEKAETPVKAKEPILRVQPEPEIKLPEEPPETLAEVPRELLITEARPSEARPEEAPPTEIAPRLIGFQVDDVQWMLNMGFEKLADYTDFEGWKLKEEESKKLAEIWTPILNEHSGALLPYIPYISAVIATAIIIVPRILAYRKHQQEKAKKEKEKKPEEHELAKKLPEETPEKAEEKPKELTPEELKKKKASQQPQFLKKLT